MREAAWVSGLSRLATFLRVELPLAWPGVLSALALTFAHTMGEFGVVLMVGGSIPGRLEPSPLPFTIVPRKSVDGGLKSASIRRGMPAGSAFANVGLWRQRGIRRAG